MSHTAAPGPVDITAERIREANQAIGQVEEWTHPNVAATQTCLDIMSDIDVMTAVKDRVKELQEFLALQAESMNEGEVLRDLIAELDDAVSNTIGAEILTRCQDIEDRAEEYRPAYDRPAIGGWHD